MTLATWTAYSSALRQSPTLGHRIRLDLCNMRRDVKATLPSHPLCPVSPRGLDEPVNMEGETACLSNAHAPK